MSIPLLLKVKRVSELEPHVFSKASATAILFQDKQYKFSKIYENEITDRELEALTSSSSTLVLIGPTGSGKTTTLKAILHNKLAKNGAMITAFEVSENRSFVDFLDNKTSKKYVSSIPIAQQLRKRKLTEETVDFIFSERKTSATDSNAQSSRSCLIVHIYEGSRTTTLVDLMGNEKFDPATTNTFANTNVSAITQLLLAKTNKLRSPNLVTNLIFRGLSLDRMRLVLHLDQCGDQALIKSSLYNIVDVVKDFKVEPEMKKPIGGRRPVPSYARPTASSASPRKKAARPYRITKPIPATPKGTPRSVAATPLGRRNMSSSSVTGTLYSVQLKSLNDANAILQGDNEKLKEELESLKAVYKLTVEELKGDVEEAKKQVEGFNIKSISQTMDSIVDENKFLRKLAEEYQDTLRNAIEKLVILEKELDKTTSETSRKVQDAESNNKELKAALECANTRVQSLLDQLEEAKSALRDANKNLELFQLDNKDKNSALEELKSTLEKQKESTEDAESTVYRQKHIIESMASEHTRLESELFDLETGSKTKEAEIADLTKSLQEKETEIEIQMSKAKNAQAVVELVRSNETRLQEKYSTANKELQSAKAELGEILEKHTSLISYNKYIVEKYSTALQEKESIEAEAVQLRTMSEKAGDAALQLTERDARISSLEKQITALETQAKLDKLEIERFKTLEEKVEDQDCEIRELHKYKAKCDDLELQARRFRSLVQEREQDLKDEIQRLKADLTADKENAPIGKENQDSRSHKEHELHKKNILGENNSVGEKQKKLKRKASSYLTARSPKVQISRG